MVIPPKVYTELMSNISRRLTPQPVKIRSDIEVTCFGYEGIDAIKAALKAGEALSTESVVIRVSLVAPPLYAVRATTTDKLGGVELMEKALEAVKAVIEAAPQGSMVVKMKVSRFHSASRHPILTIFHQ